MATINGWDNVYTNDYDVYNSQGVPETLPGTPSIDDSGHLIIPSDGWLIHLPDNPSIMDDKNTGITTDFWTAYPITIDINGDLYYYNENTGINIRGPEGAPQYVSFDDLTEEQLAQIKGADGLNGANGVDGADGADGQPGLDAYHVWLQEQGYDEEDHPISEWYEFIAGKAKQIVKEGSGQGSLIVNYEGEKNQANGEGSFASGYNTVADGNYSFTSGLGTHATAAHQFVIGKYNIGNTSNAFEIGNGTSNSNKSNLCYITNGGSLFTIGNITDGNNNVLSNKVDKDGNKVLSTNDFTNKYKSWLDNYHIETSVIQNSNNPVTSGAIYTAIEQAKQEVASKATIEEGTLDSDFSLLSFRPNDAEYLEYAVKFNNLKWNPNRNVLKCGSSLTNLNNSYTYLFGNGLTSVRNNQFVIGKYNASNNTDLFQIGNGASSNQTANIFAVSQTGNVLAAGTITDGTGNILSNKQDILTFDNAITQNSPNVVTSGVIYDALSASGITPYQGINIPEIEAIRTDISNLQTNLTATNTRITTMQNNLYHLIDDITQDEYLLGISNGKLYIKNLTQNPPSPEPEGSEEEEEENNEGGEE